MKNAILSFICGFFCLFAMFLFLTEIYLMRVGALSVKLGMLHAFVSLSLMVFAGKATMYYDDKANNR